MDKLATGAIPISRKHLTSSEVMTAFTTIADPQFVPTHASRAIR
jgi:hypothetical protein